jgi:hypothetical protein
MDAVPTPADVTHLCQGMVANSMSANSLDHRIEQRVGARPRDYRHEPDPRPVAGRTGCRCGDASGDSVGEARMAPVGSRSLRTQRNSINRFGPCRSPASVECRPGEANRHNMSWRLGPAAPERTSCSGNGGYPARQCLPAPPRARPTKLGLNATSEPSPVCERARASSSSPRQPPAVPFKPATSIPLPPRMPLEATTRERSPWVAGAGLPVTGMTAIYPAPTPTCPS